MHWGTKDKCVDLFYVHMQYDAVLIDCNDICYSDINSTA